MGMESEPTEDQRNLRIIVSDDMVVGNYANLLGVWHTEHEFTLDFVVVGLPDASDDNSQQTFTAPLVARLKIPTNVIFNIARAIADNVDTYEKRFGQITPQPDTTPDYPPGGGTP